MWQKMRKKFSPLVFKCEEKSEIVLQKFRSGTTTNSKFSAWLICVVRSNFEKKSFGKRQGHFYVGKGDIRNQCYAHELEWYEEWSVQHDRIFFVLYNRSMKLSTSIQHLDFDHNIRRELRTFHVKKIFKTFHVSKLIVERNWIRQSNISGCCVAEVIYERNCD